MTIDTAMRIKQLKFLLLALSALLFSCVDKATKFYNSGVEKFENEEYDLAAQDLRQAVEFGAPKKSSYYTIAESYRLSNRLHESQQYYEKAIKAGTKKENAHFYFALAMKANGNYLGAQSQFKKFLKYGSNKSLRKRAKKEIEAIDMIMAVGFRKDFYKVSNFKEINTDAIEYGPVLYNDRTMYFTSSRGEGPIYAGQGTRFKDIFSYNIQGGSVKKLPELINEPRRHESSATFSPDGKTMVFCRSGNGKKNDYINEIDLFQSQLEGGKWSTPKKLDISDDNAWDSSPFISSDGKTLYFSSNRDGGLGSDDIWKSALQSDGSWGTPENLGAPINTESEELFPYETESGDFYFSSEGHPGYGELDIFKVVPDRNGNDSILNPGQPLNSTHDDFAIIFDSEITGYFCSNRPGGEGDDDIYIFNYDITASYKLEGLTQGNKVIMDTISDELEILPFTKVNLQTSGGVNVASTVSDSVGYFEFAVEPEKNYIIKANKASYHTNQKKFTTVGATRSVKEMEKLGNEVVLKDSIALEPFIKNTVIEFPPIYYAYDKWDILPKSEVILDDMARTLKEHPSILVELGSHTDARGTLKYNDILSQKRAESAVAYILNKGIPASRLTAKGYGERVPKTLSRDTANFKSGTILGHLYLDSLEKVNKDYSELGHQLNRRTEFKIVGFIEKAVDKDHIQVIDNGETEEIYDEKLHQNEDAIIERNLNQK